MTALCILGTVAVIGLSIFIYKKSNKEDSFKKKIILAFTSILVLSVGLECTLFNMNFYTTQGLEPQKIEEPIKECKTKKNYYVFSNSKDIIIPNINKEVKNVEIKLHKEKNRENNKYDVNIYFTDEANKNYFKTPKRTIYSDIEKSRVINIHPSGKVENIYLKLNSDDGFTLVDSITINAKRSFDFSFLRVALLVLLLGFLYMFKPSSSLYKLKLNKAADLKFNLTVGFALLQCIAILIVGTMNPVFMGLDYNKKGNIIPVRLPMENHNQYDELACAILDGKTYIDNDDVPQALIEMENPYDTGARLEASHNSNEKFRWDVAYFNGHYYVYFGIVPLLIMYLPFRAVFNAPFPSAIGVMAFGMIFSIGVFKLIGLLIEKKFKSTSAGLYLLLSLVTINCGGALFLIKRPDFYAIPIITALSFMVWGIYFWLKGQDNKKQKLYYFLGSACCALAVGCRPQMALMSFVALPIFWRYFIKEKNIKNKNGIKNLIVLAIPYIVVAMGIMYYNYIRFGSPLDFGSSYNLTTNDVTRRGFDIGRTGLGLFTYLFQAPEFHSTFPYLHFVDIDTNYVGKTIFEYCFGGLITSTPILWFIFALPKVKDKLKEKGVLSLTCSLLLIGTALVIADTQAGGLLQRYFSDFGLSFFLADIFIILALVELYKDENIKFSLKSPIIVSVFLSLIYAILLVFSVADVTIEVQNPTLFGKILHTVEFWL